jgi:hypothetical protein
MSSSPTVVFTSLEKSTLVHIVKRERLMHNNEDWEKIKKSSLVKKLVAACEDIAIKQVLSQFDKATLEEIAEPLNIDHENNLPTKPVLKKRIGERMADLGIEEFMNKHMTESLIKVNPDLPSKTLIFFPALYHCLRGQTKGR